MDLLISLKAEKQFNSLTKSIQDSIRETLNMFKKDGFKADIDIKKLRGYPNHYRICVGDFRIRLEFEKPDKMKIYYIGRRSKAYND